MMMMMMMMTESGTIKSVQYTVAYIQCTCAV